MAIQMNSKRSQLTKTMDHESLTNDNLFSSIVRFGPGLERSRNVPRSVCENTCIDRHLMTSANIDKIGDPPKSGQPRT